MTGIDIYNLILENKNYLFLGFVFLASCIQISPLKCNPLSWLSKLVVKFLRWVGHQITVEIMEEIQSIKLDVGRIEEKEDLNRIKEIRWRILDFSNSLKSRKRDREEYDEIYKIHEEYDGLLVKYNKTNGKVVRAMNNIDNHYDIQEKEGSL